jgi:hypothetical protein
MYCMVKLAKAMYFDSQTGRRRWQNLNLDTVGHDLASSLALRSYGGAEQVREEN